MELAEREKSIIKTLAHFDVLDYPLTLLEIAKFNGLGLPAAAIAEALDREPLNQSVRQEQGLYCLRNREAIILLRLMRYRLALLKLKRARRFAAIFSVFPWIRAVAVYSSLALKNSQAGGDIDLFFITAKNRVWSARFFLNTFLKFFRLRPTPTNSCDKICASYWVDENNLDLSVVNFERDYYYYYYGCASYLFLAGSNKLESDFRQANNWIKKNLPAWQPTISVQKNELNAFWHRLQAIKEGVLGLIPESAYKNYQLKILPQKYRDSNDNKKVALTDGIIKLHHNDKRAEYNRLFEENYERYAQ